MKYKSFIILVLVISISLTNSTMNILSEYIEQYLNLNSTEINNFLSYEEDIPLSINITDMTVNAIFNILNRFNYEYTIKNGTDLPINIDSNGLAVLLPELKNKFNENKELQLKIFKNSKEQIIPNIDTYITGSNINFEVGLNITSNDEMLYSCSLLGHIKLQFSSIRNKLNIFINTAKIDDISIYEDNLNVDIERFEDNLNMVIDLMLSEFKTMMTDIDIISLVNKLAGSSYSSLLIYQMRGYSFMSLK
jgi:hypothetical protein